MTQMDISGFSLVATLILLLYLGSFAAMYHALMSTRTSQGTIAWLLALLTFPFASLPLYLVFGRKRFEGYTESREIVESELVHLVQSFAQNFSELIVFPHPRKRELPTLSELARTPITRGNSCQLLINGEATYEELFRVISQAKHYVLIEFYIIQNDQTGERLKTCLLERAHAGVEIYFLYDELGSYRLGASYLKELTQAGIHVSAFGSNKGRFNRFQINFRNHRKVVVIDGEEGLVGGLNVGDEYLGSNPALSPWRDTHCRIKGPAVGVLQYAFVEDWYWASKKLPHLNWHPTECPEDQEVLILPTGPIGKVETGTLAMLSMINSANHRLWIATPYFVPDQQIINALILAAMRGVDVRILIPSKADHKMVYFAAFSYLTEAERAGIKIYRFRDGFMHQKVVLVDHLLASIGTMNLDNRSLRLNFEISAIFSSSEFVSEVEQMLVQDFEQSTQSTADEYHNLPIWKKVISRIARLFAPLL